MRSRRVMVLAALVATLLGVAVAPGSQAAEPPGGEPPRVPHAEGTPRVAPARSPGCGSSTAASGQTDESLVSGGVDRSYIRYVPPAHDGKRPVPLVLAFHGLAEGAAIHVQHTEYLPLAEEEGFAVAFPQGLGAIPQWNTGLASADVVMVGDLLDQLEADLCIDTNRIYASGLSLGGFMTSTLACVYDDRIAAFAPVAGIRDPAGCSPSRPVPMLTFHGTADTFVPFGPIPGIVDAWAGRNGCGSPAEEFVAADDVADIFRITYACPTAPVVFYRIDEGGHSWPGSEFSRLIEAVVGYTTFEIEATDLIWEFFEQHPLPPARCRAPSAVPPGHTPARGC